MKPFLLGILFLYASLFHPAFAESHKKNTLQIPILWKLETQPASWLFGTIHLPDPRVNQLPLTAKLIFNKSDVVMTEIPMEYESILLMQEKMKRHDGRTLKTALPKTLYARLDNYLQSIHFTGGIHLFNTMQTWAVFASLPLLETQIKHPLQQALDSNIYLTAKKQGKEVGGLETILEQVGHLESFTQDEQITLLDEALSMLEDGTGEENTEKMLQWFLQGGKTSIRELMQETTPENNDKVLENKLLQRLLTDRNALMAERIAKRLKDNPEKRFFFAVGAGHLSDEKNIPYFLEEHGIKATPFQKR
jgi:uncharacterized protein YbaP (TraB family)